jgi:hypothetical protein
VSGVEGLTKWTPTTTIFHPFSASNPLRGCNSGKAVLIGLTRLFCKQQRFEHEHEHERRARSALVSAGPCVEMFPGLKLRAESYSPFGT